MFFYIVLTPIYLPLTVYEVPAIRVNTTKSTYTFTSVILGRNGFSIADIEDLTLVLMF